MKSGRTTVTHICIILFVYFVCYGSYIFVNVPFWDDWVLMQYGVDGLWELFKQVGRREHYFTTAPFAGTGNPMSWATASFICWGVVALSVYAALQGMGWTRANSFWAAVLTAAVPLNQARFGLAMTPYAFSAAFYSLALVLLVVSTRRQRPWLRVPVGVLLTLSFSTNSFLTMALLAPVVAFLALRQRDPERRFWPAARGALMHVELFILPVAYWVSKSVFQPVYGLYASYNKFQMGPLEGLVGSVLALINQRPDFRTFFPTTGHLIEGLVLGVVCLAAVGLVLVATRTECGTEKGGWRGNWLLVAGLFGAALIALFPYVMVGIRPAFYALWETRHQTTLAIVAGAFGFAGMRALLPRRMLPAACMAVLGCFVAIDISASRQLLADVYESNAIIHHPAIAAIPDGTMLGVFENDRSYRMFTRHFQFYDLSSMLNAHSAQKTLVAMSNLEFVDPDTQNYAVAGSKTFPEAVSKLCQGTVDLPQYGFGDVVYNGQFAEVTLLPKLPPPDLLGSLQTALGFLFDRQGTIERAVAGLDVRVEMRPFPEGKCAPAAG
ncbi:MAG: hypothetical protein ACK4G5_13830 [Devosia sp.]